MPIHDWSRVDAGVFHHFHCAWINELSNTLNGGLLPAEYYAMSERRVGEFVADVLTLEVARPGRGVGNGPGSGLSTLATAPPRVRYRSTLRRAAPAPVPRKVVVRRAAGDHPVAVIEVVSPGNKSGSVALGVFVEKVAEVLDLGLHMLILDLHRPSRRDPQGIHGAINEQLADTPYQAPSDKPLTLAAYTAGPPVTSYVEPVAVGDSMPPMPLFLDEEDYVDMPMEATYQAAWLATPRRWREVIDPPAGR